MARAAFGISRNVASAVGTFAGLTSTAMRTALGTRSCNSPSRLAVTSWTKKIDASRVAVRPREACDQTKPHRVVTNAKDYRNRRGYSFGRLGSIVAPWRGDHGHAAADEVGHERRQPIILAI